MNILFKCDQSKFIGLGHFYRSNELANIFTKNNHKCFFLGLKPGIIKKNKISKSNEKKDIEFTNKFIENYKISIVVKDLYSLGYNWEKNISKKSFLAVIDDFNHVKHYCNLYINYHFNWFKKKDYKLLKNEKCKKLIGPKYSIVKNFKTKKFKFKEKTIFIYMGGADKNMFMLKLVKIFNNNNFNKFKKIFLINNNHIRNKELVNNLYKIKNTMIFKNKTKNFHQYMKSSDLCISAAGHTMLEQIVLKKNCLVIAQNQNQKKIASSLNDRKIITLVRNFKKINYEFINKLLKKKKINKSFINRHGKNLIYKEIVSQQII
tara:strand:- start:10777 stop:11733 length:957 start_codon:yes stop_codon:yes gene_type:complete